MANEYVLSLSGEEATRFAAAKKAYAANVILHFLPKTFFWQMIQTEDMMGGVSKDIIRWYKMTTAKKADHGNMPTQNLAKKIVTLRLEDDETVSASTFSKKDEMIVHYDASGNIAKSAGEAMGQLYELQSFLQLHAAANTAADGVFPGGSRTKITLVDDIPTTLPISITGSRKLQDALQAVKLAMIAKSVDMSNAFCFMTEREFAVLQQDDRLMSRDYVSPEYSDLIKDKLTMVHGIWVLPSTVFPQADYSLADDNTPSKNGANAYLENCAETVGLIFLPDALRKMEPEPVTGMYDWDSDKRHWRIGSVGFKSLESYRPECAAEIYVAA